MLLQCTAYVPNPELTPPGGTYEQAVDVTISCSNTEAIIWYTTDGSNPETSDSANQGNNILITETTTVRTVAKLVTINGEQTSGVVTQEYVIQPPGDGTDGDGTEPPGIEVLVVGNASGADSINHPFYWSGIIYSDGTVTSRQVKAVSDIVTLDELDNAWAYDIALLGISVLMAGNWWDDIDTVPCVWRDGVRTDLSLPAVGDFSGSGVAVDTGSEYVGGWIMDNSTYEIRACFWKDGVLHQLQDLPAETTYSEVTDILYVSGTGLYIIGSCTTPTGIVLCYWIVDDNGNDTRYDLTFPPGVTWGGVGGIFVEGGSVYICGFYESGVNSQTGFYVQDGTWHDLDTAEIVRTNGICISDGNVLVAGWTSELDFGMPVNMRAHLWKNGDRLDLSTNESGASGVTAEGNHILVSGFDDDGTDQRAGIWSITDNSAEKSIKLPSVKNSAEIMGMEVYLVLLTGNGLFGETHGMYRLE